MNTGIRRPGSRVRPPTAIAAGAGNAGMSAQPLSRAGRWRAFTVLAVGGVVTLSGGRTRHSGYAGQPWTWLAAWRGVERWPLRPGRR
jgi:hypothetical protein